MFGLAALLLVVSGSTWLAPHDLAAAMLWPAALIAGVAFGHGPGSDVFANRGLHSLGVISRHLTLARSDR